MRYAKSQLVACLTITMFLQGCGGGSSSNSSSGDSLILQPSSSLTLQNTYSQLPAFTRPILALQAPNDSSQWYMVEETGHVKRFGSSAGSSITNEVIDISDRVDSASGAEMGLLGMAFHPSFPTDPRVFLSYTATINNVYVSRISSFKTTDNGSTFDKNSESILLTVNQPVGENNHKGGHLQFGADGYLYIGFGDGGGAGDMHGTIGNGQNLNTLMGKILRIDVGNMNATTYTVPLNNTFVSNPLCGINGGSGSQACPEIYAYGFRNPWRFNFDRSTDTLWAGDVGQGAWEEIDIVSKGGNYGWRCYEGNHAYNTTGCSGTSYIAPVAEYDHSQGDKAVIGGYVYRGTASSKTVGKYIFGDEVSGRIWSIPTSSSSPTLTELIHSTYAISSFAQANDGELYAIDYAGGRMYKLVFN